jgi:DNA-nicking Smr family endonuclease
MLSRTRIIRESAVQSLNSRRTEVRVFPRIHVAGGRWKNWGTNKTGHDRSADIKGNERPPLEEYSKVMVRLQVPRPVQRKTPTTARQNPLVRYGGDPFRHTGDPEDIIQPVEVASDEDDDVDGANSTTASPPVDDEDTFVYTKGARIPLDVVRLRIDPEVEVIPPQACMERKRLTEVIFANDGKLSEIQYGAFSRCTAMKGVLRIPGSVRIIHESAFEYCTSLTEVVLQDGLKEIRNYAFRSCTSLRQVKNWGTKTRITLRESRPPTDDERRTMCGLVHPDVLLVRQYKYDVGSETILRPIFNSFCNKRGVKLHQLRLTYKGKTMFLSDIKNKTPKQLAMLDDEKNDEAIFVFVEPEPDEVQVVSAPVRPPKAKQGGKKKTNGKGGGRGPKAKKERNTHDYEPIMSVEDFKRSHSMILTKLHEEAQPRLKDIRTRLNALDLERQPPKLKSKGNKKSTREEPIDHALPGEGVGGKAGKSFFVVQVGEVQNLYKTMKPSSSLASSSQQGQSSVPMLDLHGCTREEAIVRLNESLKEWVDTAMRGYDPFVITAVIVCGCGSQVLMEAVQEWIKSTSQVRNAPKHHVTSNGQHSN